MDKTQNQAVDFGKSPASQPALKNHVYTHIHAYIHVHAYIYIYMYILASASKYEEGKHNNIAFRKRLVVPCGRAHSACRCNEI